MDCSYTRWGDQTKLSGCYCFIAENARTNVIYNAQKKPAVSW